MFDEVAQQYPALSSRAWQRLSRLSASGLAGCLVLMAVRVGVLRFALKPISLYFVRGKVLGKEVRSIEEEAQASSCCD